MSDNPYLPPDSESNLPGISAELASIQREISSQATASVIVGVLSFVCFGVGLILSPFAIYRGNKALKLIRLHHIGQQHSGTATAGKILGIIALAVNLIGIVMLALLLLATIVTRSG
jgi:hypothetical protein